MQGCEICLTLEKLLCIIIIVIKNKGDIKMKKVLSIVLTLLMVVVPLTQVNTSFAAENDIACSVTNDEPAKTEKIIQSLGKAWEVVAALPVWKVMGVHDVKEFLKNMDLTSLASWKKAVSCFPHISAAVISMVTIFTVSGFLGHMGKKFGNNMSKNRFTKWLGSSALGMAGKKAGKALATVFLAANLENIISKISEGAVCDCKGCETLDNVYNYANALLKD